MRTHATDGSFSVALDGRHGSEGCVGHNGTCFADYEYEVVLGYCLECDDTSRSCRFLGHPVEETTVKVCPICVIYIRDWDCLVSVAGLREAEA